MILTLCPIKQMVPKQKRLVQKYVYIPDAVEFCYLCLSEAHHDEWFSKSSCSVGSGSLAFVGGMSITTNLHGSYFWLAVFGSSGVGF